MGDHEPLFVLRKFSATKLASLRSDTIERYGLLESYLNEFVDASGTQNFLNGFQNYPQLKKIQTNLYKCFLPQSWIIGKQKGISGFIHPEGIYDDPNGGALRTEAYPR